LSDELTQILSPEEKVNFHFEKLFTPLKETKPILYNPYTEPQWARAKREYDRTVDPVEAAVANRFRRNIAPIMDRPQLLLNEFQKYKNLMRRPTIRRALVSERESLLSLLKDTVKKMEASVDRDDNGNYYSDDESSSSSSKGGAYNASYGTKMISPIVAGIVYLRQLGAKAGAIYSASKDLLNDLDNYAKFATQCEKFISRVKSEEDNKFDTWLSDLKQKFEDGDETLRLQGSLLAWKDGVLTVNFSEDLVRFLREFRQLDELGFDMPKASSGNRSKVIYFLHNYTLFI
jgi:dynein heavy chain 2